jgi:predicted NBD/HSP70 family sugar kinase
MLRLIRRGHATTRAELVENTGLARSTVSQRVDQLLAHGLLVSASTSTSTGGRPATVLAFNHQFGVMLAGDVGATRCHTAVTDLDANILAEATDDVAVSDGPDAVLPWLVGRFDTLLAEAGRSRGDVRGVGVGLPGPVEFAAGQPVHPPIMPGWNGVPVAARLSEELSAPVLVDNDVNVMALGEHSLAWPTTENLLFVKVGTGIGCGIVAGGHIYRGANGAAGDLGHVRAPRAEGITCTCGNDGCLEAIAGGGALASRLREAGIEARDVHDVTALLYQGDRTATALARQAGRDVGDVLASIVNFFNPAVVVFGGETADAAGELLTGVREVVYQRSTPLATSHLTIAHSHAGARAGVVGASVMATEHILAPQAIDRQLVALA